MVRLMMEDVEMDVEIETVEDPIDGVMWIQLSINGPHTKHEMSIFDRERAKSLRDNIDEAIREISNEEGWDEQIQQEA